MDIIIQGIHIWYPGLFILGLCAGFLSGFFGVGGGFLLTPLLNIIFSIPYNIAVGSSLGQIAGTSASASFSHGKAGGIDYKLGLIIAAASIFGVELGARILQSLKAMGTFGLPCFRIETVDFFLSLGYIVILTVIGFNMFCESRQACKELAEIKVVDSALTRRIRNIAIKPVIAFKNSGIDRISLWPVAVLGFVLGILSGLLGIGGGLIGTPALIYLFGVPTKTAIGTGLFSIIFTAGYGCLTHSFKGNADLRLVLLVLAGGIVGAQLGAFILRKVRAPRVRLWFSLLLFAVAGLVLVKLLTNFKLLV